MLFILIVSKCTRYKKKIRNKGANSQNQIKQLNNIQLNLFPRLFPSFSKYKNPATGAKREEYPAIDISNAFFKLNIQMILPKK